MGLTRLVRRRAPKIRRKASLFWELSFQDCGTAHMNADTVERLMGKHSPMKIESESFTMVREALERNYACMGVTCSQVGALLDEATGEYLAGEPCKEAALQLEQLLASSLPSS